MRYMKQILLKFALVTFALGLATTAVFAMPFDGHYKQGRNGDCSAIGSDGGAILIQDNLYRGLERTCKITNPTKVRGLKAVLYDFQCNMEGESTTYRAMIQSVGGGTIVISTPEGVSSYYAC